MSPCASPTSRPSVTPSSKPSQRPSHTPTSHPSVTPTHRGDTNGPTSLPTVAPTINLRNLPKSIFYQTYVKEKYKYQVDKEQISYASFNYRGIAINGTCSEWNDFISDTLTLLNDVYMLNSIALTTGYQNFTTGLIYNQTAHCNDKYISNDIALALVSSTSWRGSCNGRRWAVGLCSNAKVLCADCDRIDCGCSSVPIISLSCNNNDCSSTIFNLASFYIISFHAQPKLRATVFYNNVIIMRESILLSLNVSASGAVSCKSFVSGYTLSSNSIPLIRSNGYTAISVTEYAIVEILISDLAPESKYDLYCYWEDFANSGMTLSEVNATRRSVTTSCCRSMSWVTVYSSVVIDETGLNSNNIFDFQLDTAPLEDTIVSVSTSTLPTCNGSALSSAYSKATIKPNKFSFRKDSLTLLNSFKIEGTTGRYKVTLAVASGTHYTDISTSFAIQTIPDPPVMISCVFDSNGITALISFDSDTDQGASVITSVSAPFICNLVLSFAGANQNTCLWVSRRHLQINNPSSLNVGDEVFLKRNVTRAACVSNAKTCSLYSYTAAHAITLERPTNPILPVVSLSTSRTISLCDNIILDPTNSYGSGGRPWRTVYWTVVGSGDVKSIASLLNSEYNKTTDYITISNSLLSNGTITFTLYLTNHLLRTAAATATVYLEEYFDAPIVRIVGPSRVTMMRWQSLTLSTLATPSSCTAASMQAIVYRWKVYLGTRLQPTLTSSSADPKSFKLPAYTLNTTSQYTIQVEASYGDSISSNTATVYVIVGRAGVHAVISGGTSQILSLNESNTLDASASTDIDYPGQTNLAFSWQCSQYYPNFGSPCDFIPKSNTSMWQIPRNFSTISNIVYQFSVFVVSLSDGLVDQAFVQVTFIAATTPKIVTPYLPALQNTNQKIILTAKIVATKPTSYAWVSVNAGVNISTVTSSVLSGRIAGGAVTLQLTLNTDSLSAGLYYTFRLKSAHVGATASEYSSAEVTIFLNRAVYDGIVSVTPSTGLAFYTNFYFLTQGWIGAPDHYPLSFSMSYSINYVTGAVVIRSRSASLFAWAYLSAGLQSMSYAVTCYVQAFDILGGTSKASTQVYVYLPLSPLASINTFITEIFAANIASDADLIMQIAYSAANALNAANCTLAPFCARMNRENCTLIAHTCGPCLKGYLGVPGPANTVCNNVSKVIPDGRLCRRDADCLSGLCLNKTCVARMKMCSANCSHAGACNYYDSIDDKLVPSCSYTDTNCYAKCDCFPGHAGFDCSVNAADVSISEGIRETVCWGIHSSLSYQVNFIILPFLQHINVSFLRLGRR